MPVASLTLADKIAAVLLPAGFADQGNDFALTGSAVWARWDAEKQVDTHVALSTEGAPFVVVAFLDADGRQLSSSKFYVGAENVWGFFENTLKLSIQSI